MAAELLLLYCIASFVRSIAAAVCQVRPPSNRQHQAIRCNVTTLSQPDASMTSRSVATLQVAVSPCAKGTKSPTKRNKKHRKEHRGEGHGHGDDEHN
jgi:hypothetical protein